MDYHNSRPSYCADGQQSLPSVVCFCPHLFSPNPLAYNNSEYCTCDVLDNWLRVIDICRQVSKTRTLMMWVRIKVR